MRSGQADEDQLCGGSGPVQAAVEHSIINAAAVGGIAGGFKNSYGFGKMIIHLQQADEDSWVYFTLHKECNQSAGSQNLLKACFDSQAIDLTRRMECCRGFCNRNPRLTDRVDSSLVKVTLNKSHSSTDAPLLEKRGRQGDNDHSTIDAERPPCRLGCGLSRPRGLLCRHQHFVVHTPPLAAYAALSPLIEGFAQ